MWVPSLSISFYRTQKYNTNPPQTIPIMFLIALPVLQLFQRSAVAGGTCRRLSSFHIQPEPSNGAQPFACTWVSLTSYKQPHFFSRSPVQQVGRAVNAVKWSITFSLMWSPLITTDPFTVDFMSCQSKPPLVLYNECQYGDLLFKTLCPLHDFWSSDIHDMNML
jgi:hypothetical protein